MRLSRDHHEAEAFRRARRWVLIAALAFAVALVAIVALVAAALRWGG